MSESMVTLGCNKVKPGKQRPDIATSSGSVSLNSTSPIGKPPGQNVLIYFTNQFRCVLNIRDQPKHLNHLKNPNHLNHPSAMLILPTLPASSALVLPLAVADMETRVSTLKIGSNSGKLRGLGRRWFWMLVKFSDVYLKWDFSKKVWIYLEKIIKIELQDEIPCTEHSVMFLSQYRPKAHSTRLSTSFLLHCFLFSRHLKQLNSKSTQFDTRSMTFQQCLELDMYRVHLIYLFLLSCL